VPRRVPSLPGRPERKQRLRHADGLRRLDAEFPDLVRCVLHAGAPGNPAAFWVCFDSNIAFADVTGQSVKTGLLGMSNPFIADAGQCLNSIAISPDGATVTEQITYPAIDATASDPKHM
jgi:hypothetical protein